MSKEWKDIKYAPRDGSLVCLRNSQCPIVPGLFWFEGGKWLTKIPTVTGWVKGEWNVEDGGEPTEFLPFKEA